jgi:MFS family permease
MGDQSDYEFNFGLLYTLYSAPNVILPFFGGYLVDRIGVRTCLLIFCTLITVGQLLFSFGISIHSWPVMFIGRLVFGLGGESL